MAKAIRIHGYGGPEVLKYEDIETPTAGEGEVLVRVKAMGVNPVDWKVRSGLVRARFEVPFPAILGGDIAGVVESVGPGVSGFKAGDEVFGMLGLFGGYSELVVAKQEMLAPKPKNLSFVEAASVPLAALTAWLALVDAAKVKEGDTVLVHAAAGGVGSFAVQIAKAKGARVIGTASSGNADYVRGLGADQMIDYRNSRFEDEAKDVDIVLDLIAGDTGERSLKITKKGGIIVGVLPSLDPEKAAAAGVRVENVFVRPNGGDLAKIGRLIEEGKIKTEVAAVFPLPEVGKAHEASQTGHTRGKIVLQAA